MVKWTSGHNCWHYGCREFNRTVTTVSLFAPNYNCSALFLHFNIRVFNINDMPANKKYLTKSPWLRLAKILIGSIGGYTVMFSFHLLICKVFPQRDVVVTSFITGYIIWAILLLLAFLSKSVWKIFTIYLVLTLIFSALYTFL